MGKQLWDCTPIPVGHTPAASLALHSVISKTAPCFFPLPVFIDRKGSGKPVPGPGAHPDDSQGENPSHQNRAPADQGTLHGPDEERAARHGTLSAAAAALQIVLLVFSCLGWLHLPGWVGRHLFISKSWTQALCQACPLSLTLCNLLFWFCFFSQDPLATDGKFTLLVPLTVYFREGKREVRCSRFPKMYF